MARRFIGRLALFLLLCFSAQVGASGVPATAVIATPPQPSWKELSSTQKSVLAPLSKDWDQMENFRKKKWIGIAERFPKLGIAEQQRVQERMRKWAEMTPDERAKVRNSYREFQQLPPEKRAAIEKKWQTFNNLPEEEKSRLRNSASGKSTSLAPPSATSQNRAPQQDAIVVSQ